MLGDSFLRGFVMIFDRENSRIGFLGSVIKTSGAAFFSAAMATVAAVF